MPTMGQAGMCLIWCRTESPILTNIINNMFALLRLYFEQEGCICLEQLVTLQLKAFFLGFYDYLYRNPEEKKAETGSPRIRELFNRFMRALESRYRESRDVSYYADLLNVSAKYLGIVTRRITGHTAKSVIDHYVVLQIKQSLATEEKSIKELSWDYHFCDISFFCRYFKQHTGLTPPTIPQNLTAPPPSVFQTRKRNNFHSIGTSVSHAATSKDNKQVWLTERNLFFSFIMLLYKSFDF